jgi:dTDP-4-dehydrorhamnose reductase
MRTLITGARGTVGRALVTHLRARGDAVVAWDRERVPIDRYEPMERFVRETGAEALLHLAVASTPGPHSGWQVTYEWTSELAWICRTLGVRFVFVSTALVFSGRAVGPFTPASIPDAPDGYGREKRDAEARTFAQNPDARVVRLGWQIGDGTGSNEMRAALAQELRATGRIEASERWLPACSFLEDSAAALRRAALAETPPGLYLIDSNTRWTFFAIARALFGDAAVVPKPDGHAQDQRMIDPRLGVPPLSARLASLD